MNKAGPEDFSPNLVLERGAAPLHSLG